MTSPAEMRGDRPGIVPRITREDLVGIVVLGVLYYAAARLGLRLAIVERNITPLWPPTGLALVAFLRYGRRLWPGVAIAALLVNLPIANLPAAVLTAAGNTLAPMVAAWLLERVGFRQQIDRVRDVVALVGLGALLSMTISATIGSAALVMSSGIPADGFWPAWTVWWTGDAMGILVVAPFLLCLLTWNEVQPRLGLRRLPEALVLLALLVGASVFATWNTGQLLFLLPPLVGWIAWRFQLRGAAPAVLLVSTLAAWAATRMVGWFADLSLTEEMLTLQLFNATIAFTAFFLSALVSERTRARERLQRAADDLDVRVRQRTAQLVEANEHLGHEITERRDAETKLRRSEHELAEAQDLARLGRWEWDLGAGTVSWSDDLYRIHGYEPGAFPMTFEKAVELVPEEDRQRIERNLAAALAMRQRELPEIEYRIVRPDGELRALLGRARLFFDEAGSPVRMLGVVQDVTERVDYDRQHRIAETLQRALLPQDLPAVDGLALAARYLPAEVGFKAGGDWYDVIPLAGGKVGLVIGDVAGHGLEAASVMGQLRMAVRAYALEGHRPSDVVAHADSVLRVVAPDEIATMTYAEVDPGSGAIRFVGAGHPPPIALGPEGARYLELPKQGVRGGRRRHRSRGQGRPVYRRPHRSAGHRARGGVGTTARGRRQGPGPNGRGRVPRADHGVGTQRGRGRHRHPRDGAAPGAGRGVPVPHARGARRAREDATRARRVAPGHRGRARGRARPRARVRRGLLERDPPRVRPQIRHGRRRGAQGGRRRRGRGPRLRPVATPASAGGRTGPRVDRGARALDADRADRPRHRGDDAEDAPRLGLGVTEVPNLIIAGENGVVVASLSGEIDLSNATEITDALLGGVPNEALGLVIDLSGVSYLDSAGVRMLAELDHRLGWRAQALRIVAPEESRSRRVLAIAGLERVLSLATSVETARSSMQESNEEPQPPPG